MKKLFLAALVIAAPGPWAAAQTTASGSRIVIGGAPAALPMPIGAPAPILGQTQVFSPSFTPPAAQSITAELEEPIVAEPIIAQPVPLAEPVAASGNAEALDAFARPEADRPAPTQLLLDLFDNQLPAPEASHRPVAAAPAGKTFVSERREAALPRTADRARENSSTFVPYVIPRFTVGLKSLSLAALGAGLFSAVLSHLHGVAALGVNDHVLRFLGVMAIIVAGDRTEKDFQTSIILIALGILAMVLAGLHTFSAFGY